MDNWMNFDEDGKQKDRDAWQERNGSEDKDELKDENKLGVMAELEELHGTKTDTTNSVTNVDLELAAI